MNISEFSLRFLIIFFPGLITVFMVEEITSEKYKDQFFFICRAFFYGILSYFLLFVVKLNFSFFERPFPIETNFWSYLLDSKKIIEAKEIFWASIAAFLLSILISINEKGRYFQRLTLWLGISKLLGKWDVWRYSFSTSGEWVTVRDHKNDLRYDGWVSVFSDAQPEPEVLLRDVAVYRNSSQEFFYQVGALYLSRKREEITIEFTGVPVNEKFKIKAEIPDDNSKEIQRQPELQDSNNTGKRAELCANNPAPGPIQTPDSQHK